MRKSLRTLLLTSFLAFSTPNIPFPQEKISIDVDRKKLEQVLGDQRSLTGFTEAKIINPNVATLGIKFRDKEDGLDYYDFIFLLNQGANWKAIEEQSALFKVPEIRNVFAKIHGSALADFIMYLKTQKGVFPEAKDLGDNGAPLFPSDFHDFADLQLIKCLPDSFANKVVSQQIKEKKPLPIQYIFFPPVGSPCTVNGLNFYFPANVMPDALEIFSYSYNPSYGLVEFGSDKKLNTPDDIIVKFPNSSKSSVSLALRRPSQQQPTSHNSPQPEPQQSAPQQYVSPKQTQEKKKILGLEIPDFKFPNSRENSSSQQSPRQQENLVGKVTRTLSRSYLEGKLAEITETRFARRVLKEALKDSNNLNYMLFREEIPAGYLLLGFLDNNEKELRFVGIRNEAIFGQDLVYFYKPEVMASGLWLTSEAWTYVDQPFKNYITINAFHFEEDIPYWMIAGEFYNRHRIQYLEDLAKGKTPQRFFFLGDKKTFEITLGSGANITANLPKIKQGLAIYSSRLGLKPVSFIDK